MNRSGPEPVPEHPASEGEDLTHIRALRVSCKPARRGARRAHYRRQGRHCHLTGSCASHRRAGRSARTTTSTPQRALAASAGASEALESARPPWARSSRPWPLRPTPPQSSSRSPGARSCRAGRARAARQASSRREAPLRILAGACGPSAHARRDGENPVTLTAASADRSAAVATSLPTWGVVLTSLPTWRVASQIGGVAWRSEPARLESARRSEPARLAPARQAARLPGGERAPRGPATRRHRHTRQSLRARQPTPRGGAQAIGSTRPCRYPKRARRGGHLHPPWRPRGRPVLP